MKILGYGYDISSDVDPEFMEAFGRFYAKNQQIRIASGLHEQQKVSTILHEILEALNFHLELKLEHAVITSLEAALYQVLTENGVDLLPLASEIKEEYK